MSVETELAKLTERIDHFITIQKSLEVRLAKVETVTSKVEFKKEIARYRIKLAGVILGVGMLSIAVIDVIRKTFLP